MVVVVELAGTGVLPLDVDERSCEDMLICEEKKVCQVWMTKSDGCAFLNGSKTRERGPFLCL